MAFIYCVHDSEGMRYIKMVHITHKAGECLIVASRYIYQALIPTLTNLFFSPLNSFVYTDK